jgi:hypothetical protein
MTGLLGGPGDGEDQAGMEGCQAIGTAYTDRLSSYYLNSSTPSQQPQIIDPDPRMMHFT